MAGERDAAGKKRTRPRISQEAARSFGVAFLDRFPSGVCEGTVAGLARALRTTRDKAFWSLNDLRARGVVTTETLKANGRTVGIIVRVTTAGMDYLRGPRETMGQLGGATQANSHLGEAASGSFQSTEVHTDSSEDTKSEASQPPLSDRFADTASEWGNSVGQLGGATQSETQIVAALREIRDALKAQTEALLSLRAVRSTASQPVAAPPARVQAQDALSPEDEAKVEKASGEALRAHVAAGKEVRTTPEALRIGMANKMREALLAGNRLEVDVLCKAADDRANAVKAKEAFKAKEAQWEAEAKAYREAHQAKQAAEREARKKIIPMPRTGS